MGGEVGDHAVVAGTPFVGKGADGGKMLDDLFAATGTLIERV
jgi:hypothetical protein